MPERTRTVAIFNASQDTIDMLTVMLSDRGYRALAGHADDVKSGETDFVEFMNTHKPDGIIWDVAPPYDRNWKFFKLIRTLLGFDDCAVVLTTTHKKHLDTLVGQDTGAIEIVGKPYDLEAIADAIGRAIDRRDSAPE
jgi:CheY-like chemotaxis protein